MPAEQLADIAMTSISFTNTLDGDEALKREQRRHARFVNTAMVVTLLGAASSDMLEDGRVVSGAGGQHDLVAMAQALDGARSIIAVRATRQQDRRTISNIVWRYANATVPRHLRDMVVTEYGIADLRGNQIATALPRCWPSPTAAFSRCSGRKRIAPASWRKRLCAKGVRQTRPSGWLKH